jgi:ATP-dependent DNA helicase RecG
VYSDKIIFWNEGQLPENWTIENLLTKHPSKPYNPDIANALFRSGYIESWGRGTLKIIKECERAGLPQPSLILVHNNKIGDITEDGVKYHLDKLNKKEKLNGLEEQEENGKYYETISITEKNQKILKRESLVIPCR